MEQSDVLWELGKIGAAPPSSHRCVLHPYRMAQASRKAAVAASPPMQTV
jgi:hypothetical protein